jgi:hypothetical protein
MRKGGRGIDSSPLEFRLGVIRADCRIECLSGCSEVLRQLHGRDFKSVPDLFEARPATIRREELLDPQFGQCEQIAE